MAYVGAEANADAGVKIVIDHAGLEAVHAHEQARSLLRLAGFLQEGERALARLRLAVGGDRILEVDDDGVGAGRHRLVELLAAVGGNEQE